MLLFFYLPTRRYMPFYFSFVLICDLFSLVNCCFILTLLRLPSACKLRIATCVGFGNKQEDGDGDFNPSLSLSICHNILINLQIP